jgi:hypothetical protein
MVGFGDDCSTILAFVVPGKSVNYGSSSWKMDVSLETKRKHTFL